MSFATDIQTLLTGSSAINSKVGGVYFQNLPDNTPVTATNIVYQFNLSDSVDILEQNNLMDIYTLDLILVAPNTQTIDELMTVIRTYLDNYDSVKFRDIKYQNSDQNTEGDRGQYTCSMTYKIIYQN